MKILANGLSMHYEIAGDGEWLVLIHGAGDNLGIWWNQIPAMLCAEDNVQKVSGVSVRHARNLAHRAHGNPH